MTPKKTFKKIQGTVKRIELLGQIHIAIEGGYDLVKVECFDEKMIGRHVAVEGWKCEGWLLSVDRWRTLSIKNKPTSEWVETGEKQ
jgi:hypothetical protein